jgi:hypothetical protein
VREDLRLGLDGAGPFRRYDDLELQFVPFESLLQEIVVGVGQQCEPVVRPQRLQYGSGFIEEVCPGQPRLQMHRCCPGVASEAEPPENTVELKIYDSS